MSTLILFTFPNVLPPVKVWGLAYVHHYYPSRIVEHEYVEHVEHIIV